MSTQKRKEQLEGLRSLSVEELQNKCEALTEDLFWLQFKNKSGQSISASEIQHTRKQLARAKTLTQEKAKQAVGQGK